jgi:hypothetical protein
MMHALSTPKARRSALVGNTAEHARRLVDFLLNALTTTART